MRVLITGAASGIGYATAITLAKRGHFVYLTTHTESQLLQVKNKIKKIDGAIVCFKLDITNPNDYQKTTNLEIDCLICHAGIGEGGSLLDIPIDKIRKNFETNYFGTFSLIQFFIPQLLKKKNARILITSSIAGMISLPFLGSYCSTKAAISSMVKSLRQELKLINTELQVGLIEPGIYNTGFNEVMLDNKNPYFEQSLYFNKTWKKIQHYEKKVFHFLGKNNYNSIVKKFVKGTENIYVKKIYRAPLLQRISVKLYLLFFG